MHIIYYHGLYRAAQYALKKKKGKEKEKRKGKKKEVLAFSLQAEVGVHRV